MKTNRIHSLDALRGCLMLLGVYFHIAAFHYAIYGGFIALFVGLVHYFRMPAFFLISGFFTHKFIMNQL